MNRRDFLACGGLLGASVVGLRPTKPIVRIPTDCDLTVTSLRWAEQQAGFVDPPDTYSLRVHPEMAPVAERVLRAEFGSEWRASLVIDETLAHVDEWYLEGSKAVVHSLGA